MRLCTHCKNNEVINPNYATGLYEILVDNGECKVKTTAYLCSSCLLEVESYTELPSNLKTKAQIDSEYQKNRTAKWRSAAKALGYSSYQKMLDRIAEMVDNGELETL